MLLSQRTPSLEKEKDAVVQFLTHIQHAQRPFIRYQHYALSLTFSPARRASYTTQCRCFLLKDWLLGPSCALSVCLGKGRPTWAKTKDERDGESNEGTFVSHPEGRVVEPPCIRCPFETRFALPGPFELDIEWPAKEKCYCETDNSMADRAAAFHPSANLLPCRRRYA